MTSTGHKSEKSSPVGAGHRVRRRPYLCDCHSFGRSALSATALSIDDLGLVDYVANAARQLLKMHPNVVFTSGRRNLQQQADAMAGNVVKNRKWIEQTYAASPQRGALQKWVDDHPQATTQAAISAGLLGIMNNWTDDQKKNLTRHFSGEAFDVNPVADGDDIKKTINALPNLRKFRETEGGLTIWHAEFER